MVEDPEYFVGQWFSVPTFRQDLLFCYLLWLEPTTRDCSDRPTSSNHCRSRLHSRPSATAGLKHKAKYEFFVLFINEFRSVGELTFSKGNANHVPNYN